MPTAHRDFVLRRLEDVQIWSSGSLVLRRFVVVDNERIYGKDEVGRVLLEETENLLRLYCSRDSIFRNALPWHFIREKLSVFFDISQDRQNILSSILTTQDPDMIEDFLERANLSTDFHARSGDEYDTDEETNVEEYAVDPASQTPDRRLDSTQSSHSVGRSRPTTPLALGNSHATSRRTGRRVSSRGKPQTINVDSIVRVADVSNLDNVDVLGPSTNQSVQDGMQNLLRASLSTSGTPNFRRSVGTSRSPRQDVTNEPSPSRSSFNMDAMSASLPNIDGVEPQDSDFSAGGDREKEIGFGGELYVRRSFTLK